MAVVQFTLNNVLLALQLILGLWQIIKLTPIGGIVQGVMAFLLRPLGLFSDYARVQILPGKLFKTRVFCTMTTENLPTWLRNADVNAICVERKEIKNSYIGDEYKLTLDDSCDWSVEVEFRGEKIFYYITPKLWLQILSMNDLLEGIRSLAKFEVVNIKGFREIWEGLATGGVMSLSEVLDSVILDNMYFVSSNCTILVPVNLSVSEEKLLKFLNLVGLFFQNKKLHWLIPFFFSLTSAVLEFCTPLRIWLYGKINVLFCSALRFICHKLPYSMRREVYSLGKWVDNLQPSNDLELRVVRSDRCVPLAGGAKLVTKNGATRLPQPYSLRVEEQVELMTEEEREGIKFRRLKWFNCEHFHIGCLYIPYDISQGFGFAHIHDNTDDNTETADIEQRPGRHICILEVECNMEEYIKICTLVSCIAKNGSGSLKSYDHKNKVQVYGLRESIIHYAKSGFPPVYEVEFKDVILT